MLDGSLGWPKMISEIVIESFSNIWRTVTITTCDYKLEDDYYEYYGGVWMYYVFTLLMIRAIAKYEVAVVDYVHTCISS